VPGFKTPSAFFESSYTSLRDEIPMRWMMRFFEELIEGKPRRLVDLETGAGKTELVVIWLLALAWFGLNGRKGASRVEGGNEGK
jgi:CRISPR-associated endonuclease/helicase Cas3